MIEFDKHGQRARIPALAIDPNGFGENGCPCRKLHPDVLVMQSAQDWHRQNTADRLDGAGYRRIFIQG